MSRLLVVPAIGAAQGKVHMSRLLCGVILIVGAKIVVASFDGRLHPAYSVAINKFNDHE